MARKIFFSFHYERDAWRASVVRYSDLIPNEDEHGFIDAVDWEELERKGQAAIKGWIQEQLKGTSVTVVLIGAETAQRPWIDYEIRESWGRGNAIVGLRIHNIKDSNRQTDSMGPNPLDNIFLENGKALSSLCKTYDWVDNDGRNNLGTWAEEAAQTREQYKGETKLRPSTVVEDSIPQASYSSTGPTIIKNPSGPWAT